MVILLKMAIEIVDFSSYKTVIFHSYVSLPEGNNGKQNTYSKWGISHSHVLLQ